jgi:hypothetical protein
MKITMRILLILLSVFLFSCESTNKKKPTHTNDSNPHGWSQQQDWEANKLGVPSQQKPRDY